MFGLRFGANGPFNWGLPRRPRKDSSDAARRRPQQQQQKPGRARAATSGAGGLESYSQRVAVSLKIHHDDCDTTLVGRRT